MNIQYKVGNERVTVSEPIIYDVYHIEENEETGKFYIWSNNGYSSIGIVEYKDLNRALYHIKKLIKDYFLDRGEENPKGF